MSVEERIAIAETKIDHIKESQDRMETKIDLLISERHEGIGKKSVWGIIYGSLGAIIVTIIDFFRP